MVDVWIVRRQSNRIYLIADAVLKCWARFTSKIIGVLYRYTCIAFLFRVNLCIQWACISLCVCKYVAFHPFFLFRSIVFSLCVISSRYTFFVTGSLLHHLNKSFDALHIGWNIKLDTKMMRFESMICALHSNQYAKLQDCTHIRIRQRKKNIARENSVEKKRQDSKQV